MEKGGLWVQCNERLPRVRGWKEIEKQHDFV